MSEPTPKFTTVIENRRAPFDETRYAQYLANSEISRRKIEGRRLADESIAALEAMTKQLGIDNFFEDAAIKFGKVEEDRTGMAHYDRGGPKKIGATTSKISYYVYCWSNDASVDDRRAWLQYATVGRSLDYLKREPANRGYSYHLSRYAAMLIQGDFSDGKPLFWHGELPGSYFDPMTAKSPGFASYYDSAVDKQNDFLSGSADYRKAGNIPLPPFIIDVIDLEPDPADVLTLLDSGLHNFAERHYMPPDAPLKQRRTLLPSLFGRTNN